MLESWSAPITWSFGSLVVLAFALHLLVRVAPARLIPFMAVPWALELRRSTQLRYQAVLYCALHTHKWARISHYSLAWDPLFWFVLLFALHPLASLAALCALLVQAALLRAPKLAGLLALVWVAVAGLAAGLVTWLDAPTATWLAMAVLTGGGCLRLLGHIFEPLPPGIVRRDRFAPMRDSGGPRLLVCTVAGLVCEFAAGLPCRLFLVQVAWFGEWAGLTAPAHGSYAQHLEHGRSVFRGGWSASPVTAWMLEATPEVGTHAR